MLESLRSFVSGWVAKLLLILLVGSFALWGVSGSILGGADTTNVASVGETNVKAYEFLGTYNRSLNEMQRRLGRRLTREQAQVFGIERNALGQLVASATLDEFARLRGLSLSEQTLARLIAENPAFQDSTGRFNRDSFRRAIYEAQMREGDFISMQNASAVRNQLGQSFAEGQILPDVFDNALAAYASEERKFDYITLNSATAGQPPAPTEEQLKTYFEENRTAYKAPEYRKLAILALEPKDVADEGSVSEAEIAEDYQTRSATYAKPEMRRVQQLVFADAEKAEAAVKALDEGAVFETVLSENGKTAEDVDLGLLPKSQLPRQLQDAAFSLPLAEPSEIIDGPFGPTMIRVTEIEPAKTTSLDEVKDDIRKDLALRKAADTIINLQEAVEDARAGGAPLEEVAERLGYEKFLRTIDAIDRNGRDIEGNEVANLPESGKLLTQAFQSSVDDQPSPIDIGTAGYAWYDVISISEPRDRTFEEAKKAVSSDWMAAEQEKLVMEQANALLERLEKGETMETIAAELSADMQTTDFLKRNSNAGPLPASAIAQGFAGDANHSAVVDSEKPKEKLLLKVAEIKRPEAQNFEAPDQLVEQANEGAANDLLSQFILKLQDEYPVTQNPALITQVLSRQ